MRTRFPILAALAVAVAVAPMSGCGATAAGSDCADFPAALGFQPLERMGGEPPGAPPLGTPVLPAPPPDLATTALDVRYYALPFHAVAHGRGVVRAPIARVWAALHDPVVSRIHSPGDLWVPTMNVEAGFPVSFDIQYTVHDVITVVWTERYRAGVVSGTDAAPTEVALRYQKTCGDSHIAEESGSLVATPLPCDPAGSPAVMDCAALELEGWLIAITQGAPDVGGTLNDMYANLQGWLIAHP